MVKLIRFSKLSQDLIQSLSVTISRHNFTIQINLGVTGLEINFKYIIQKPRLLEFLSFKLEAEEDISSDLVHSFNTIDSITT